MPALARRGLCRALYGPDLDYTMTEQTWCAEGYDKNARFVSDLGMPVVELLNAKSGERILDLGCGDGVLTHQEVAGQRR